MNAPTLPRQMSHPLPVRSPPAPDRRSFVSSLLAMIAMPRVVRAAAADATAKTIRHCPPGPWGRVSYYHFYLEAPDYVVAQFPLPNTTTKWIFNLADADSIPAMLKTAGVAEAVVGRWLDPRRVAKDTRSLHVFPIHADLEAMSPEVRSAVYALLAQNPANAFHYSPVFFLADSVEEWARDSDIPDHIQASIKALSYKSGNALVFSDVPLLLSQARTVTEARFIVQKLTRVRTLMPRLELSAEDDIPEILNYWTTGLGLRRREIEPLLHAIVRTENVSYLDLLHLLPPLSRKLLYTYPDTSHAMEGRLPDCHWTSLNFFKFTPEPYLLDSRLATSTVREDFEQVEAPYGYGDILMFLSPDGRAIHSANYLAGDLLYSKNGSNMLAPWLLMRLDDLKKLYGVFPGGTRIEGFRHK